MLDLCETVETLLTLNRKLQGRRRRRRHEKEDEQEKYDKDFEKKKKKKNKNRNKEKTGTHQQWEAYNSVGFELQHWRWHLRVRRFQRSRTRWRRAWL